MKKITLFTLSALFIVSSFTQNKVSIPQEVINRSAPHYEQAAKINPGETMPYLKQSTSYIEIDIGKTKFDLQSNSSMQKRIHVFEDGTIGSVFTMGFNDPQFPDRGTGYSFFDGNSWSPMPEEPIESDRTGWPAYSPWGENGEIIVSHISGGEGHGLFILKRETKGMGDWQEMNFTGPEGHEDIFWPRVATGGTDFSTIHLLAVTSPIEYNGSLYEGLDGALLYSRTNDGGETWEIENIIIDGIDSSFYLGFQADIYDIRAEGDNVTILIGDYLTGLVLLKSTDGGSNWEKTVIWEHPYPKWNPYNGVPTDTFYCADGAHSLDFDADGMVHVVFGVNRSVGTGESSLWFPAVDGVGYWNESRSTFSNNINALNPYSHPESELEEDFSLIGWSQDIDNNGEINIIWDEIAYYYLGLSSMPQIIYDHDYNILVVIYSSVTEGYDNAVSSYRHLWQRGSPSGGETWGSFTDLTVDPSHQYDECIFPSLATASESSGMWPVHSLTYLMDTEPGLAFYGTHSYTDNYNRYMKTAIGTGINNPNLNDNLEVSQNRPNPFTNESTIRIHLKKSSILKFEIINLTGEKVYKLNMGNTNPGIYKIVIDGSILKPGLYFYVLTTNTQSITRKMIVK